MAGDLRTALADQATARRLQEGSYVTNDSRLLYLVKRIADSNGDWLVEDAYTNKQTRMKIAELRPFRTIAPEGSNGR